MKITKNIFNKKTLIISIPVANITTPVLQFLKIEKQKYLNIYN